MNITIFISGVTGGGAEKVACTLASYLTENKHEVDMLTMSDEEATYFLSPKVKRTCLLHERERKNYLYNNLLRILRLVKYILTHKPDCYTILLPDNILIFNMVRFLTKSKLIASERVDPNAYTAEMQHKLKKVAKNFDGWVFQTQIQRDWYGSTTGTAKTIIIPNAINPDVIKPYQKRARNTNIVTAGRLTEQKNQKLLIDAFGKIADKHATSKLVIYGDGPKREELQAQIENMGLTNRVSLPGYSPNVTESVSESNMFVLSSDYEGMPNALMEAMALGVPCVSTDCGGGGARFLIENGKNGLLVPIQDADALAEAMDRILSDKVYAESLGQEAYKLGKKLAPDVIYGNWEKFIEDIVLEK